MIWDGGLLWIQCTQERSLLQLVCGQFWLYGICCRLHPISYPWDLHFGLVSRPTGLLEKTVHSGKRLETWQTFTQKSRKVFWFKSTIKKVLNLESIFVTAWRCQDLYFTVQRNRFCDATKECAYQASSNQAAWQHQSLSSLGSLLELARLVGPPRKAGHRRSEYCVFWWHWPVLWQMGQLPAHVFLIQNLCYSNFYYMSIIL